MPPPVLVVSSRSQSGSNSPAVRTAVTPKSVPLSISLSSLVSTGGVVTLAGGWKAPSQSFIGGSCSNSIVDAMGRRVPTKVPVQIKVPVVQTPGSSPLILMQQKPAANQSKSLFRLLPKGRHPIPLGQIRHNVCAKGPQFATSSGKMHTQLAPTHPLPTLLVQKDGTVSMSSAKKHQKVVMQRTSNQPLLPASTTPASSSVQWHDLSSKTPTLHKPSYVPRKSFPNINNGVGSFQKFKILDGKQLVPEQLVSQPAVTSSNHVGEKPRNAALKAVLTSAKPATSSGAVTVARLFPAVVPKNGFYPIQPKLSPSKNATQLNNLQPSESMIGGSFQPVSVSVGSDSTVVSSFRPVVSSPVMSVTDDSLDNEGMKKKLGFLRRIDLIPTEQADKFRSRRFRKRRVAANPIYSGGMYVSNEVEPKRHCPDVLMSALDGLTPPDVIMKRPRGRPRGSSKSASPAQLQKSTFNKNIRSSAGSPVTPAHIEELRQLRGILDVVASASKAVSASAGIGPNTGESCSSDRHSLRSNVEKSMTSQLLAAIDGKSLSGAKTGGTQNPDQEDEHEDQCATCRRTGEVLMCDTCSRVYHLSCTTPPLTTVPQGMWVCSKCKTEFESSKSEVKWPGIVQAVHSYMDHCKERDAHIEAEKDRLQQSTKLANGLQAQTKALTTVVMGKVNLRSKAMKEKQAVHEEVVNLRKVMQNVWNLAMHGRSDC